MNRVFLSYARGDDEPFVKRLHDDLIKAGFTVWFDREALRSRGLSFHQEIKDAIRTEVDQVQPVHYKEDGIIMMYGTTSGPETDIFGHKVAITTLTNVVYAFSQLKWLRQQKTIF